MSITNKQNTRQQSGGFSMDEFDTDMTEVGEIGLTEDTCYDDDVGSA